MKILHTHIPLDERNSFYKSLCKKTPFEFIIETIYSNWNESENIYYSKITYPVFETDEEKEHLLQDDERKKKVYKQLYLEHVGLMCLSQGFLYAKEKLKDLALHIAFKD